MNHVSAISIILLTLSHCCVIEDNIVHNWNIQANLIDKNWTLCHLKPYDDATTVDELYSCPMTEHYYVFVGALENSASENVYLGAYAPAYVMTTKTSSSVFAYLPHPYSTYNPSYNVYWYNYAYYGFGFSPKQEVSLTVLSDGDTATSNSNDRLSWSHDTVYGGYRAGVYLNLDYENVWWHKVVYYKYCPPTNQPTTSPLIIETTQPTNNPISNSNVSVHPTSLSITYPSLPPSPLDSTSTAIKLTLYVNTSTVQLEITNSRNNKEQMTSPNKEQISTISNADIINETMMIVFIVISGTLLLVSILLLIFCTFRRVHQIVGVGSWCDVWRAFGVIEKMALLLETVDFVTDCMYGIDLIIGYSTMGTLQILGALSIITSIIGTGLFFGKLLLVKRTFKNYVKDINKFQQLRQFEDDINKDKAKEIANIICVQKADLVYLDWVVVASEDLVQLFIIITVRLYFEEWTSIALITLIVTGFSLFWKLLIKPIGLGCGCFDPPDRESNICVNLIKTKIMRKICCNCCVEIFEDDNLDIDHHSSDDDVINDEIITQQESIQLAINTSQQ